MNARQKFLLALKENGFHFSADNYLASVVDIVETKKEFVLIAESGEDGDYFVSGFSLMDGAFIECYFEGALEEARDCLNKRIS